jgi:ribonuclease P protein component
MAVSKRVGNAVVRNRVKRYTREFFRRYKMQFDPPCDVVVVARRQAADLQYAESVQQFTSLLRRYLRQQRQQQRD